MTKIIKNSFQNIIKDSFQNISKNISKNLSKNSFQILFEERSIAFMEGTNLFICLLKKVPKIGDRFTDKWFGKEKEKERVRFGILVLICTFVWEFLKKFMYAVIFVYLPYKLLGRVCINVLNNQEKSIIYIFMIMTTFCGSITNNTMFTMSDRDYIMLRVMHVNTAMHYIGRILYKMITEFVYFTMILLLFGVSFRYSIAVSLFTMAMRPIGEGISLLIYDNVMKVHTNRGSINGIIMAAAFIVAYVVPYVNRSVSDVWYKVASPKFLIIMVIIGAGAVYYLRIYKKYEQITQEIVYIRREDLL